MIPDPTKNPAPGATPGPGHASGQGSDTALEALIRQRKRAEQPQEHHAGHPPVPAQDAR